MALEWHRGSNETGSGWFNLFVLKFFLRQLSVYFCEYVGSYVEQRNRCSNQILRNRYNQAFVFCYPINTSALDPCENDTIKSVHLHN